MEPANRPVKPADVLVVGVIETVAPDVVVTGAESPAFVPQADSRAPSPIAPIPATAVRRLTLWPS
ncbi:hypothetical protein [Microbispora sp. GKU 823]|uniref:hypothetical protein n=1 Tax=Microbispora sp. GKU 823 TaxID=1652100 RepID=UPI002118176B|nr:hypothetical protein [Microbispora sp. GKU 823]